MRRGTLLALALALGLAPAPRAAAQDSPGALLDRLEAAWAARSPGQYLELWNLADAAAREREEAFAQMAFASADPRLLLERPPAWPAGPQAVVLARSMGIDEPRARVEQWRLRLERTPAGWRLAGRELLGRLDGLVHLSLDPAGFRADGLALRLPDFELRFERGTLFTSPPALGPTALVFVGQATVRMTPRPATEREQLRRFAGQPELVERVEQAFVRLHPADWHYVLSQGRELQPDPQAGARLAAAQRFFEAQSGQSFLLDAGLPGSPWWVLPSLGDALVSFKSRHGVLSYTVSAAQPEAISLFDRRRKLQVCLYPAEGKSARYDEDETRDADVLSHHLRARFDPELPGLWAEDRLRVRLKQALGTLRLRLKESLQVTSVSSRETGNLLFFRVRGQDSLMVSLGPLAGRAEVELEVRYGGPLAEMGSQDEQLEVPGQEPIQSYEQEVPLETPLVYSSRSLWYPQVDADDYATAELELEAPVGWTVLAGGRRTPLAAEALRSLTRFQLEQPVKYLAVALARAQPRGELQAGGVRLALWSTPRKRGDSDEALARAGDALAFYERLFGPSPYPDASLLLGEGETPGGHSPAGLVVLRERPLLRRGLLREDPATLWGVPGFFLAHELAHQWWGQGVAGRNYHERWLSEGLAQYSAALWARQAHGEDVFQGILRHMARWALRKNDEGPIYLGQRLGHVAQDPQVFRAVVYDKGAYVLHMLAGLVGEKALADGLRAYAGAHRYGKAGSDDLRRALEQASGRDLGPYFEAWVYGTSLPVLRVERKVERKAGGFEVQVRVRPEQLPGPLPLEISARHPGGVERLVVELKPEGGVFTLRLPERPTAVEVNADRRLLATVVD